MRIVRWQYKILYVIGALVANWTLAWLVGHVLPPENALSAALNSVIDLSMFIVGARVFRGTDEELLPPRAWWRMTSRRPLSRRLGILFAAVAALYVLLALWLAGHPTTTGGTAVGQIDAIVFNGVLAYRNFSLVPI